MTQALIAGVPVRAQLSDGLDHLYCCNPDRAHCGLDISALPEVDETPNLCVVCDDLDDLPCPDCGFVP